MVHLGELKRGNISTTNEFHVHTGILVHFLSSGHFPDPKSLSSLSTLLSAYSQTTLVYFPLTTF